MEAALRTLECYGQVKLKKLQGVARISREHQCPLDVPEQIRLVVWEQKWGAVVQVTIHHALMDGFSIVLMIRQFKMLLQGQSITPYPQMRKSAHPSPVLKQPQKQHLKLLKLPDGRRLRPIVAELFSEWLKEQFPRSHWAFGRLAHGRTGQERRSIGVFCKIETPAASPWVRSILNELPEFDFAVPGSSRILHPWLNPLSEIELQSTLRGDTLYLTFRVDTELLSRAEFEQKVETFRSELKSQQTPDPLQPSPEIQQLSLKAALQHHALHHPEVLALDTPDIKLSYAQLWKHLEDVPSSGTSFRKVGHVLQAVETLFSGEGYTFGSLPVPACPDPCCVVYTSGTTGPQKPIRLQLAAVERYLSALSAHVHIRTGERVLQAHAWTFDGHLENLFLALLHGATLVVPEATITDPRSWVNVDHASVPTALFHLWSRTSTFPSQLKTLIVGGEALQPSALQARPSELQLINTYGPAEATISVSIAEDHSLGIPVDPQHFQLVDAAGKPVSSGEVGEIQLSGPQLSPDVESPYLTGDLAFQQNGKFWFAGRKEGWVKVRGHRVFLQEIGEELCGVAGVQHAQAVQNRDRVQVFFFPADAAQNLHDFTREWRLPLSLIPLNSLPMTLHGKVDVQNLASHVLPKDAAQNNLETLLMQVAAEVLECPIGPEDDLFSLGADSLDAVQISATFGRKTGRSLPTDEMYRHRTLRRMLSALSEYPGTFQPAVSQSKTGTLQSQIAVTGANGFLGVHLLAALQAQEKEVLAVVRASSAESARIRLQNAAVKWQVHLDGEKLQVVSLQDFLAQDSLHPHLINAAGHTALNASQDALRAANVELVAHLAAKTLHLHQCSSLSVLDWHWQGTTPPLPSDVPAPQDPYSLSKWQAEQWLEQQTTPSSIYRITRCWGSAKGGPVPEDDLAVQMLKRHPEWVQHLDVLPVDVVARSIVQHLELPAGIVHLRSPITMQQQPNLDALNLPDHPSLNHQDYLKGMLDRLNLQKKATSI
ncbi:hypothetical protein GCM10008938_35360 [Deinococcus roseus]|uniref:Carrier domain-containing protein n=2 Tax=Deinococcus roseus TaxID=392414 RepID=A0ABQ2D4S5_9DEIO|nr:hypothetical protein GCM10008938_35360 [Deinococcus roseus]